LRRGWRGGLDPSPQFSTRRYLAAHPDVAEADMNPLLHYFSSGMSEGRRTFRSDLAVEAAEEPETKGLEWLIEPIRDEIDEAFYYDQLPDLKDSGVDPAAHYVMKGWREGLDPRADFSTEAYLRDCPDVASTGMVPLGHYILAGRNEGRPTQLSAFMQDSPRFARIEDPGLLRLAAEVSPHFDAEFYLARHTDVRTAGIDPLWHYVASGWREGRDPNAQFSSAAYLAEHPDAAEEAANGFPPLLHAVRGGYRRSRALPSSLIRRPATDSRGDAAAAEQEFARDPRNRAWVLKDLTKAEQKAVKAQFDAEYYLRMNPDVANSKTDPLKHYISNGWLEGRDPTPFFSTQYYLSRNPDVVAAGLHPFVHYAMSGRSEGRYGRHPAGFAADILSGLRPMAERVEEWRQTIEFPLLPDETLAAAIEDAVHGRSRCVLAVSHDNYTRNVGGLQACLEMECAGYLAQGSAFLQVSPAQPLPTIAASDDPGAFVLALTANGRTVGHCTASALCAGLRRLRTTGREIIITLHSLLGHSVPAVDLLCSEASPNGLFLWVHDYLTVCPSYNLLRNDVAYCGGPKPQSLACRICVYGEERARTSPLMTALIKTHRFTVVAPSTAAAELWAATAPVPGLAPTVHEHCTLEPLTSKKPARARDPAAPIRVAFLGFPTGAKGWPLFREIALDRMRDPRWEFHHLGSQPQNLPRLRFDQVDATAEAPDAMIEALVRNEIDLVALLSQWPETFCFTAHEAVAAGTMLLAQDMSGHVRDMITARQAGIVAGAASEVLELFRGDELHAQVLAWRAKGRQRFRLVRTRMTADLTPPPTPPPRASRKTASGARTADQETVNAPST
jgi:hypothetical protein